MEEHIVSVGIFIIIVDLLDGIDCDKKVSINKKINPPTMLGRIE